MNCDRDVLFLVKGMILRIKQFIKVNPMKERDIWRPTRAVHPLPSVITPTSFSLTKQQLLHLALPHLYLCLRLSLWVVSFKSVSNFLKLTFTNFLISSLRSNCYSCEYPLNLKLMKYFLSYSIQTSEHHNELSFILRAIILMKILNLLTT